MEVTQSDDQIPSFSPTHESDSMQAVNHYSFQLRNTPHGEESYDIQFIVANTVGHGYFPYNRNSPFPADSVHRITDGAVLFRNCVVN